LNLIRFEEDAITKEKENGDTSEREKVEKMRERTAK